jgi:autotransporter-associated beta strand protein
MELGSWRGFSVARVVVRTAALALVCATLGVIGQAARAQMTLSSDLTLDSAALLMPTSALYGRSINGVAFQAEPLMTYNGYQYATWYRGTAEEDMMVARRNLTGDTWETVDTLRNLDNGDATGNNGSSAWDAHNVISMGVSGDGRLHFSWDMHGSPLRYINTALGIASNPGAATWAASMMGTERSALNAGGSALSNITYPQFITKANGDMIMNYRTGSSGSGNVWMSTYSSSTGVWDAPHQIIDGTATGVTYSDGWGSNSSDRNAYINGMNIDGTGRIHMSWVWRETATGGSNHDISYAYSDDGGDTWRNNSGAIVGTLASPMTMQPQSANNSLGLIVVPMDRGNTLMNQQAQTADEVGAVHMVMWHKTDAAPKQNGFTAVPAAYFHYYRNPATGVWTRNDLPTSRAVSSRADVAYDGDGNLYAAYVSPGPGDGASVSYYSEGDLIIATASRAEGYRDWAIVSTDARDWSGEPKIDQGRLLSGGQLSIIMQENSDANINKTSTPIHVLEYGKLARHLVWDGDNAAAWTNGSGTDWDSDDDNAGDAAFAAGNRVTFDDGASAFNVAISAPVMTSGVTFKNTIAQSYTLTGSPIGGAGGLSIQGGGNVTLANGANDYTGNTNVTAGKLTLTGSATVANSPTINLAAGATIDAAAATAGLPLNAQTLAGAGQVIGNLSAQTGSVVRVGGNGMPTTLQTPVTIIDDFADADLSQYTQTVVNDAVGSPVNVSFASPSGTLSATYSGDAAVEQAVFLRDDVSLAIGSSLVVDVAMPVTSQQLDFGLAVSTTDTPTASSAGNLDTRASFNWAAVYARPSQTSVRNLSSINGTVSTAAGVLSAAPTSIAQLYITRNSTTQFVVGYTDTGLVKHDSSTINFTATTVGSALGFFADLRSAGSLGVFDNLRIVGAPTTVYVGETLSVTGDASLAAGTTLALDVFSPSIGDKLAVSGNFAAGGLLDVNLAAGAPAPALGNVFDVLDFATASGAFDSFALPTLASGLAWNLSKLATVGALEVVVDVDLDNSGLVDGQDFLLIQRTDPTLIAAWQPLFGSRLATPTEMAFAGVPEPTTALLACMLVSAAAVRRRKRA